MDFEEFSKALLNSASLDNLMTKEFEALGKITSVYIQETKKVVGKDEMTLMDHLSLVTLELDQLLLFIENKGLRYLEYQICQDDFENLSRKQEKLRLYEKKKKAEEMEDQVNQFESDYHKSREIFEKVQKSLPKEVKKFQSEKEKQICKSLIEFIEFQKKLLWKVEGLN